MKKHGVKTILCSLISVIFISMTVFANTELIEEYSEGRYGLYYVKDLPGEANEASAQIGIEKAESTECLGPIYNQPEHRIRTMILIDNSLSIKDGGRETKIRDLLTQIINGHANREVFAISTFAKTVTPINDFTEDYNALINTVQNLTYADQDAYLINAIYETVTRLQSDGTNDYKRVIVISDGMDDNKGNYKSYTSGELIDLLKQTSCPVYAIGCKWAKNDSGLNNLFSYARQSGGESFELDTVPDLNQIISVIQQDYNAQLFRVKLPLSVLNSGDKTVQLTINTSNGPATVRKTIEMPILSGAELDAIAAEEAAAKMPTPTEEPTPTPVEEEPEVEEEPIVEEEVPEEEPAEESFDFKQFLSDYKYIVIAVAALVLAAIVAVVIILIQKKKKEDKEFSDIGSFMEDDPTTKPLFTGDPDDGRTVVISKDQGDDDKTFALWTDPMGFVVHLEDRNSHMQYDVELSNNGNKVLGRKGSESDITVVGDKSISGRHCRFILQGNDVYIEDLQSSNGTYVNGRKIMEMTKINAGDHIQMGNTDLIATF